jgi:ADP-ribose pyrophosphatase YjhB (NUDIX family)
MGPDIKSLLAPVLKKAAAEPLAASPWATFVIAPHEKGYAATTRPTGDGKFGLPGGKLDPGEDPLAAVQREAGEEGWDVSNVHPEPLHKADVDGKPVWWYRAEGAAPRKEFKEQGRVIPTTAQQDQLTEFGNDAALKIYLAALARQKAAADITKLAPKWSDRGHLLAALPKHLTDTQAAISTPGGNVDKEMTDLALIAHAWMKSQRQKELLAARFKKFQETSVYPSLAPQKLASNTLSRAGQKDLLHGGKADNVPDREFSPAALNKGQEDEREHTNNSQVAKEIAKDHLSSDPHYYEEEKRVEKMSEESVYAQQLAQSLISRPLKYDYNKPVFQNIQNHLQEVKHQELTSQHLVLLKLLQLEPILQVLQVAAGILVAVAEVLVAEEAAAVAEVEDK